MTRTTASNTHATDRGVSAIATTAAAVMAVACLYWWFSLGAAQEINVRSAGDERTWAGQGGQTVVTGPRLAEGGAFKGFDVAAELPASASWPRFRGPESTNIVRQPTPLADAWPDGGPPELWRLELGDGYAGPAVHNGRVYVLDYDVDERADMLRCFALADGRELWRRWYTVRVKPNHGMSRTVPAVTDRYCVTIGPKCHVMCVDATTGAFKWGLDLARDHGTDVPLWYTGQCPVIDDGLAILAPCGRALLMAVDCETGEIVWETPNPKNWKMSHASIMPMQFAGRRMWVYPSLGGIVGVAADGDDRGRVLWQTEAWRHSVIAPSPVCFPDGRIFLAAGYGVGSIMLQLEETADGIEARVVYEKTRREFACEQHTPIRHRGHLYTVMPKDGGARKEQLACMTVDGTFKWASGKDRRFGLGPYLLADDKLYVMSDRGTLVMARAVAHGYRELDHARVLDGREAWAPLAIVDGRLLTRDATTLVCLDIAATP